MSNVRLDKPRVAARGAEGASPELETEAPAAPRGLEAPAPLGPAARVSGVTQVAPNSPSRAERGRRISDTAVSAVPKKFRVQRAAPAPTGAEAQVLVAGAGIAGGTLARLAEQGFQVKLFEAGPPTRDWFLDVPLLHGRSSDDTFAVDGYSPPMALLAYFVGHYEAQVKNVDLKLHEELGGVLYPRGQGPGGSGNVNANVAVMPDLSTRRALYVHSGSDPRLHPDNLEKFFARAQDPGPLFSFLETLGRVLTSADKLKATNFARLDEKGWQAITRADPTLLAKDPQLLQIVLHILKFTNDPRNVKLSDILVRLFTLFDSNNDLNHGREGFTLMPVSIDRDGRRSSVADRIRAVLATRPDTLALECETKVHSLILDDSGTRVEGMRVLKPHPDVLAQRQKIYAMKVALPDVPPAGVEAHNQAIAREVEQLRALESERAPSVEVRRASNGYVLSAGAFEDPMILIRSGIGPKAALDALGIPPAGGVYREAVGRNLKDRKEITMYFHAKDEFALLAGLGLGKNPHSDAAMKVWEKSGRGPYGSNGVVASYQFRSGPGHDDPDLFAFFVPAPFGGYKPGFSTDVEKYPKTFTAILLDKDGKLVSDDSRLMTPAEFEALRAKLGTVAPDPADPTGMTPKIDFNYQRPRPGEDPPLYSGMLKMKALFADSSVLTEFVPGDPFGDLPTGSLRELLPALTSRELFPAHPDDDIRSTMDWFRTLDVPLHGAGGAEHKLTLTREGSRVRLTLDGAPVDPKQLGELTLNGRRVDAPALAAALTREFLIEYQFSQQWGHHANGTTSLGPDPDHNVVGSDYRVHGIENLWVVSAAATPAAVNPGPFIQLYVSGAIGEAAAEAIGEQLIESERVLGKLSPVGVRIPDQVAKKNTFAENLLVTVERARAHVGDSAGELTGEALSALLAVHKKQGFSKGDLAVARAAADRAVARADERSSILKTLASEVRRLRKDQSLLLDVRAFARDLVRRGHLPDAEALALIDGRPLDTHHARERTP